VCVFVFLFFVFFVFCIIIVSPVMSTLLMFPSLFQYMDESRISGQGHISSQYQNIFLNVKCMKLYLIKFTITFIK